MSESKADEALVQKFLSNLLIFFALSLCALCAFQWVRESRLRGEVADLHRTVYLKLDAIQNLEAQLKRTEAEVARLDALRVELSGTIKTNQEEIQTLTKYSEKLEKEVEAQKAQRAQMARLAAVLSSVFRRITVHSRVPAHTATLLCFAFR